MQPGNATASNNLGNILRTKRRFAEAEVLYRSSMAQHPSYVLLQLNLGRVLVEQSRSEEAIQIFRAALELAPGNVELRTALAGALSIRKHYVEAAVLLRQLGNWAELQSVLRWLADWSQLARVDTALLQQLGQDPALRPSPWGMINVPELTAAQHRDIGYRYASHWWAAALKSMPLQVEPPSGEKLRVGYLSCDFFDHATLHLLIGVLEAHDQERVEIHLFDHSPVREDAFTRRLAASGLRRHELNALSDEAAARLISEQRLHILVDIKGYTTGARLGICAYRPAPVLVSWLGYPGSLGHPRLADYIIGDETVTPPEHSAHFSETLALLPHCYQPNDRHRPIAVAPSRSAAGLPESGVVLCSFNQVLKLNPREFDIWCLLLEKVPDSVLWLLDPEVEETRSNLRREMSQRGIDTSRLLFAPRLLQAEHLARLSLADLALDSFPCTSHTTASDALWVGLPMVARLGETFASRVSSSLLRAHGFAELVAKDEADYVEKLLVLATSFEQRAALRTRLMAARMTSPLFDTLGFTRDLEALYEAIWADRGRAKSSGTVVRAVQL
nr:hypothetical protein FFPRI1PSEUD_24270 [Pseudomonas sp. FFPRI_1]